tara:strand:+ start:856 stop:1200 length:345 start_codon:yes stop_codon:yes gene_type:complete
MKKMGDHKSEVLKIYRQLSKDAIARNQRSISINDFRSQLEAKGFSCTKKDGTPIKDGGLRLAKNKAMGSLKDSGIASGKWANEAVFEKWKKERFLQMRAPEIIPDVGGLIDELE